MNFFERQEAAKGTSLRLVVLFAVAVIALVGVIDGVAALVMGSRHADASNITSVVIGTTVITLLIISGGMLSKTVALRQGGSAVATSVGATPVDPTTTDPTLRRFVNIVEEMSLASGVPTPRLFVLSNEPGINAFAAGFTPADAAITVTSGALSQLNRDELQGVIGHEFSHILNGDMRLNIRLIGLLSGILLIGLIGLRVLQFGGGGRDRDNKNAAPVLVIALAMTVLGFVGVFFANLIKAAVSRQREWLADASAVQFTRQTTGLEGALKKIAGVPTGSTLRDTRAAAEVSHMLFGEGRSGFSSLFATHPPLDQRIKALDPSFDPAQITALQERFSAAAPNGLAEDRAAGFAEPVGQPPSPAAPAPVAPAPVTITPEQMVARAGTLKHEDLARGAAMSARIPDVPRRLASQPTTAPWLVLAMLVSDRPEIRTTQLLALQNRLGVDSSTEVTGLFAQLGGIDEHLRLPLVSIALPQLAARPAAEQEQLVAALNELALADGRVSMFEYAVTRLVWSYLADSRDPKRRSQVGTAPLAKALPAAVTLLGALAVAGSSDPQRERAAFDAALARLAPGTAAPAHAPTNTWQALDEGWPQLDSLTPADKQRLVEAMVVAVLQDNNVTASEAELLRSACALIHVPIPAIVA